MVLSIEPCSQALPPVLGFFDPRPPVQAPPAPVPCFVKRPQQYSDGHTSRSGTVVGAPVLCERRRGGGGATSGARPTPCPSVAMPRPLLGHLQSPGGGGGGNRGDKQVKDDSADSPALIIWGVRCFGRKPFPKTAPGTPPCGPILSHRRSSGRSALTAHAPPPPPLSWDRCATPNPAKERWAVARVHRWQAVQSAGRNGARQWPTRP